jgi:hypothetical protein
MAKRLQVVIDSADPDTLARFWAEATGYVMQSPPDGFATWQDWLRKAGIPETSWNDASAIVDPAGVGPRIFFQRVPEEKAGKNRLHLDINQGKPGDEPSARRTAIEAESRRLSGLGATVVQPFDQRGEFWIVMRDPEGNEFCIQ